MLNSDYGARVALETFLLRWPCEEYEKVSAEKRKFLKDAKSAERKVVADEEFAKIQLVNNKQREDEVFIKLVSVVAIFLVESLNILLFLILFPGWFTNLALVR